MPGAVKVTDISELPIWSVGQSLTECMEQHPRRHLYIHRHENLKSHTVQKKCSYWRSEYTSPLTCFSDWSDWWGVKKMAIPHTPCSTVACICMLCLVMERIIKSEFSTHSHILLRSPTQKPEHSPWIANYWRDLPAIRLPRKWFCMDGAIVTIHLCITRTLRNLTWRFVIVRRCPSNLLFNKHCWTCLTAQTAKI